jgi:hypothetical protein
LDILLGQLLFVVVVKANWPQKADTSWLNILAALGHPNDCDLSKGPPIVLAIRVAKWSET